MIDVTSALDGVPANCPLKNHGRCPMVDELGRRQLELELRAVTDDLTGLWNRAQFNALVRRDLERCLRQRLPLSLVLVDIDHFKRVNDRHGHSAGDHVLRELAALTRQTVSLADAVFRWGGEEFAVLAGEIGHRGAAELAERLRARVAECDFPVVGQLTISLGVAEYLGEESVEDWFQRADGMLYAAKHGGRNQVRVDARGNSDLWAGDLGASPLHLVWQEVYESGEPSIDADHRELFERANALIDAWLSGRHDLTGILRACDHLIEHIVLHFRNEEALLERHAFSGYEAHRRAHAAMVRRAEYLRRKVAIGSCTLGKMLDFLVGDVIARHLAVADREFFPLFASLKQLRP